MTELKINPAFKNLIPPMAKEEYAQLEENIKNHGVMDSLVVWKQNHTLLDGHNRLEIAKKLGIEDSLQFAEKDFATEDEAKVWLIEHHMGRRNLDSLTMIQLAELKMPFLREEAKAKQAEFHGNQHTGGGLLTKSSKVQKPAINSRKQIAELAGVSEDTLRKAKFIEQNATPEQISSIRSGEKTVNTVYREMQPGTKTCRVCAEEKPASRFHDNTCLDCYNARRNAQKREQRRSESVVSINDWTKEHYTIELFQMEFKSNADIYIEDVRESITTHYSWLWAQEENKKIAVAALDGLAAAILKLKGLV